METSTRLGKASLTPRGAYDPTITYHWLDVVQYQGSSYIVKRNEVTGVTPEEGPVYMLMAQRGSEGPAGPGSGDMLSSVYDPQNKAQDIFQYIDEHSQEDAVTISKGGEMILDAELLAKVGDGPYTLQLSETIGDEIGGGSVNGVKDVTIKGGENVTVSTNESTGEITVSSSVPSSVTTDIESLKSSVSEGKSAIAGAITDMGVSTAFNATFSTMAANIKKITTGVNTSDATATINDILSGKTAYVKGSKITGNIVTKTSSNLTASGATITVPAGYYATDASKSVATATQATPSITVNSSGLITASATQSAGYVTSGTKSGTKQLTTKSATTITPKSTSQTAVSSGIYTTGAITVSGDSNLTAANIKNGVSIFGVNGTYSGNSDLKIGTASSVSAQATTLNIYQNWPSDILTRPFILVVQGNVDTKITSSMKLTYINGLVISSSNVQSNGNCSAYVSAVYYSTSSSTTYGMGNNNTSGFRILYTTNYIRIDSLYSSRDSFSYSSFNTATIWYI